MVKLAARFCSATYQLVAERFRGKTFAVSRGGAMAIKSRWIGLHFFS
jgi:hypothetical protein